MTEEEHNEKVGGMDSEKRADETENETGVTPVTEAAAEVEDLGAQLATLQERLAQAEASLAEAEKAAAEHLDGWQRAQASFANYRKRTESEQSRMQAQANARLLSRILPVMDDFKRAFEAIPEADRNDPWLEGIRLVQRKLMTVLDSENVKPIEVEPGQLFDPNVHEAVLDQEVEGFDEGEIVTEIETGYTLGDRVLRPSLVVVAKGRAPEVAAEKPAPDETATEDATDEDNVEG